MVAFAEPFPISKESVMVAFAEPSNARQFCEVLRQQADLAVADGAITRREHRLVNVFSWLRPRKTQDVMEFVQEKAALAGLLPAGGKLSEIDWDNFREFIKEILPMIIEFIKALLLIFGGI